MIQLHVSYKAMSPNVSIFEQATGMVESNSVIVHTFVVENERRHVGEQIHEGTKLVLRWATGMTNEG